LALQPHNISCSRILSDKRGGGVLLLAGRNGLGDGGWGSTLLAETLPTHLSLKAHTRLRANAGARAADSLWNRIDGDALDADATRNLDQWQTLPELANFQPLGALKPGAVVLLEPAKTRDPLLVWQRYGRGSTYVFRNGKHARWQMSLPSKINDTRCLASTLSCRGRSGARCGDTRTGPRNLRR